MITKITCRYSFEVLDFHCNAFGFTFNIGVSYLGIYKTSMITTDKIRATTSNLKSNRNDPLFMFSSDCLKNTPLSVFEHLTYLIKSFLIHSNVSNGLLLATLIPIPKDKLGDLTSSNNYRSIALGSLILKIFDWIIILLFGKTLSLDDLQFGYQKNCSTTMCTWMVIESISYFTRNGADVFTCVKTGHGQGF